MVTEEEVIPSPPKRTTSKEPEMKLSKSTPSSCATTPVHSPAKRFTKTTSASSSPAAGVKNTPKDIAAAVTARLSRPKRPSGVTRHLSNSSLTSGAAAEESCGSLTTTRHKVNARTHANGSLEVVQKSNLGFVRGSSSRSTMPTAVARTQQKKLVAETAKERGSTAIGSEEVPAPPRRSTSIRSKPGSTGTPSPEPAKQQTSGDKSKNDKSMAGFINRLSSPKKKVETSDSKVTTPRGKPVNPRMRTTSADTDKSFFKKIIEKRKSAPQVPLSVAQSSSSPSSTSADSRQTVSKC